MHEAAAERTSQRLALMSRTDAAIIPGVRAGFESARSSIDAAKRASFKSELKKNRVHYR